MRLSIFTLALAALPAILVAAQENVLAPQELSPRSAATPTSAHPPAATTPPPCVPKRHAPNSVNRANWDKFYDLLFLKKDGLKAYAYATDSYIQHNPFILDGRNNTLAVLVDLLPAVNITRLRKFWDPEKQFGIVHYRMDGFLPVPAALADLFKFEGGCIVEHWDVIQGLPENATNPHPLW